MLTQHDDEVPNAVFLIYVTLHYSNICQYFSHARSAHCKLSVTQSDVEPKAATAAAAALTTKITVTGKAGITFYWANAHCATIDTVYVLALLQKWAL